jgi:DNA topoisomerase-1
MTKLFIVESPNKCKKIKYLLEKIDINETFLVYACCGHFREISDICRKTFHITFSPIASKKKYLHTISKILKNKTTPIEIWVATDNDREGESIAWHLCKWFKLKINVTKRLRFNEITLPALSKAYHNPDRIDMNLVEAQFTRQIIDRSIGFTFSSKLSSVFSKKWLSAGRCQTPTLKLIMDNKKKREQASENTFYKVFGAIGKHLFTLNQTFENEKDVTNFLKSNIGFEHEFVKPFKTQITYRYPPKGLTTSKLQQFCSTYWKWSPSFTMSQAQDLYENGLITYHRTESTQSNPIFQTKVKEYIGKHYGDSYIKSNLCFTNSSKFAHECIHPTNINTILPQNKLYSFIHKITLQSCMEKATLEEKVITISSPKTNHLFQKILYTYQMRGFTILDKVHEDENKNSIPKTPRFEKIQAMEKLKEYIPFLNEAQVIAELEKKGIGRPSTFASFVSKIESKKYVEIDDISQESNQALHTIIIDCVLNKLQKTKEKLLQYESQKIILSPLGEQVAVYLYDNFNDFFNYGVTKEMEMGLDNIAKGEDTKQNFLEIFYQRLEKTIAV